MGAKPIKIAAAVLAAAIVSAPAASADMEPIDCGSTSFSFAAEDYDLDCERDSGALRAEESSGSTQVDVMSIKGNDPYVFMTVVDIRIVATRIYMEHRGLKENFLDAFTNMEIKDWNKVDKKNGYDVAEFTAEISGYPSSCIAIQRYTSPAHIGFKRRLIGMGCSPASREPVYAALTKLRAPGD
jgi:hypothetical protein